MENWEVVQLNKETGEEKIFGKLPWNTSKETAETRAALRRMIVSDKYEIFIRQAELVHERK
jgi:hypothetical protein